MTKSSGVGGNYIIVIYSAEQTYRVPSYVSTGNWVHHKIVIPDGVIVDAISIDYRGRRSCKIRNIQLERGTTETAYTPHTKEQITTGFPELHSAGTAYDVIDFDGGEIRRNVGVMDLGTLNWRYATEYGWWKTESMVGQIATPTYSKDRPNAISDKFEVVVQDDNFKKPGLSVWTSGGISIKDDKIQSVEDLSGAVLQYELATPTTEPVTIPEPLQEWLPVEPGGTVTFKNADESKQLPVPNGVSWVRKLNEVE